ncbi:MAG: Na+ dependent nucleoside transporter, partial [Saprospiraceae bacterium]|nr:Na+ dependent nucleoside transporter [Saprospiraceae bacterium]
GKQLFGMHLLTASIISAPAAIVAAKVIYPETDREKIDTEINIPRTEAGSNVLDSLSTGTTDGVKLAVNVGAMLLAFMAFIYLANGIFFQIGEWTNINASIITRSNGAYDGFTLQYVFGILFSPIAWLLGVPGSDMIAVGQMLGEKTILNEFFAYVTLTDMKNMGLLTDKSIIIGTYALCGFANFASIGIQIGGIGAIAPGQRKTLTELGIRALVGGTIACFLTAIIAGVLVREL